MRAIVIRAAGDPSVLALEDWPVPEPGEGEVLIEIRAAGVSYHDVVERNGTYQRGVKFPLITGYEIAGVVTKLGPRVRTLEVGDRVCNKPFHSCGMCRFCRNGMETACRQRKSVRGGYAEYVALNEETLVRFPEGIGFAEACMLGASTAVALNAVRDTARVRVGETVLISGASGGLGLPSIEITKASGGRAIALTRSEDKREALLAAGADEVIVAASGQDFSSEVMALTGDRGADAVIDNIGSAVFAPLFKCLAVGGRYAFVGQLFREDIRINPARIFFKRAVMIGVGSARRDQLEDAIGLVAAGKVKPRVALRMKLEQAAEAHAIVEAGEVVGRVVLEPAL